MQKNQSTEGQQQPESRTSNNEKINPFKEASNEKAGEELSPEEEAAAEQQRKEALTERD
ncbi:hypothetical protein HMI54_013494 [Coelomomyces lativittatus]|nr:hypothetical protein HMI54_013494 [Coelomomyces lativittatus]